MALTYTPTEHDMRIMPQFELPTVMGEKFNSKGIQNSPAKVIAFICNHCPYVKAIEHRLIVLAAELSEVDVPLIGICSNDPTEYPEDSAEELKKSWIQNKYLFPYLVDHSQVVAKAFGAVCTPDLFVFNRKNQLAYRGRLDDSWKDPTKVTRQELKEAVQCTIADRTIPFKVVPSMGCSIKWKAG